MPGPSPFAEQVYAAARRVPRGRVVSYGALGSVLSPPLSGRMVGRIMRHCDADIPWWRVLARTGLMPIWKIDPAYAAEQSSRLQAEGVEVVDGRVDMRRFELTEAELARLV